MTPPPAGTNFQQIQLISDSSVADETLASV